MVVMQEGDHNIELYHRIMDLTVKKDGISFVDALNEKYVNQDEIADQIRVPRDKSISTEITFVGFGKVSSVQKQLRRLASIDVSGRNITSAGDLSQVAGSLDRVMILNLAENHLTWNEIIKVLWCLPNLREIIITSNNLHATDNIEFPPCTFSKLNSLVMGRVDLSWQIIVEVLSKIWTSVDQIDLWDNKLTETEVELTGEHKCGEFVKRITSLTMSKNKFLDLTWAPEMGLMPNLIDLDISRCQLKTIGVNAQIASCLKNLRTLNISYNNIEDWRSISVLNLLPHLISLICNDNPFYTTEKLARPLTVAQLANIKTLNREMITNTFRRDSEITYVRRVFPEYKAFLDGTNSAFGQVHPRYEELIKEYEIPEDLISNPKEDKYITIELCYDDKKVVKKLPCDMRVSNLQMLCKRLFKIRPSNSIEIVCCVAESPEQGISYPLDQEGQTLHFFSVKTNNLLIIKQC